MVSRRDFVIGSAVLGGATAMGVGEAGATEGRPPDLEPTTDGGPNPPVQANTRRVPVTPAQSPSPSYTPVVTPNGSTLPWREVDGVKVGHLIAEPVEHEMAPGMRLDCWGYNGGTPGPTIEAVEGDRVRIYVTNRLPEPTTVHWHGIILPCGMDGVQGLTQRAIPPGETWRYELTFEHAGTFMYHPHADEMTQMALGMMGMIVVHPRRPRGPRVDRDFVLMTGEWYIEPGTRRPNPLAMADFNMLTFNGKAFPGTEPLVAKRGDRVRIRLGNLSPMDHHPVHLHGYSFKVVETDGGPIPPAAQWPETTVLVAVGQTRVVELVADAVGDWAMHCHMSHHVMNQMGHDVPNMIGVRTRGLERHIRRQGLPEHMDMGQTGMYGMGEHMEGMRQLRNSLPMGGGPGRFEYIEMGGMFTVLKVREGITSYEDPGWYEFPEETRTRVATAEELRADGIELPEAGGRGGPRSRD